MAAASSETNAADKGTLQVSKNQVADNMAMTKNIAREPSSFFAPIFSIGMFTVADRSRLLSHPHAMTNIPKAAGVGRHPKQATNKPILTA